MPRINTKSRFLLVIHRRELPRTSNTGMLAVRCIANAEAWVRGGMGEKPLDFSVLNDGVHANLMLYPHEGAELLSKELLHSLDKPVRLIVPDGNWGQASRTASRIRDELKPRTIVLPVTTPTNYRLRRELHKDGLATFEAIARALEIIEGGGIREPMDHIFRVMVERSLYMRGRLGREDVFGGVPEGA